MIILYVLIFFASFILNWGVQLSYYLYRTRKDPRAFVGQRTLLQYYSGYIGDAIIVPLINVLILYVIVNIGRKEGVEGLEGIGGMIVFALILDIVTHFHQGYAGHTNWSMPKPFRWNFAGKWHMVSFFIQVSYLLFYLLIFFTKLLTMIRELNYLPVNIAIWILMITFLVLYRIDTKKD